jgi:hypothetical protein
MKVSKKDIIIFILLAIIITTAVMAGHYKIQRDRMEAFVNQSCYMRVGSNKSIGKGNCDFC